MSGTIGDARKRHQPTPSEDTAPAETLAEVVKAHSIVGAETPRQGAGQTIPVLHICCYSCGWMRAGDYETHLAARVEQARAGEGALRERVEALADEWETAHGDPPVDPSHISVRHAKALRAVLAEGDPT